MFSEEIVETLTKVSDEVKPFHERATKESLIERRSCAYLSSH